jgi:SPX domain protein involved in polyphosphate accumulation
METNEKDKDSSSVGSTSDRFDDFYQHTDFNSSLSSLQGLLEKDKRKGSEDSNDISNADGQGESKKPKVDNKSFVRKSIKYWIHPDYVTEVKAIILRHLPIYVFGDNHDLDHPKNPLISSVYYDNYDLELYHHRLHKSHLAIAFRYRWYGELKWNHQMPESEYQANQAINKSEVFAERKTHKEDWTGDNSVKERFSIDPSKINEYNRGKYKIDASDHVSNQRPLRRKLSMRNNGSNDKPKNEDDYYKEQEKLMAKVALAQEIQTTIIERQLRPTMRTIYNRTAFQLPDDQRVRVSLDTELTFVREDLKVKKGEWKRDDVGMHWPYRHLKDNEKYLFPYAVLEVKLQTQFGQEPPQWINELTTSYLVEPVPKFSKFMHGCAMLIPEKVKINPYWFYRMYESEFDLRSPLNVATLRETSMCPVKMPWNMSTVITNFDIISPTLRRSITSRSNRITRPTRREPKLSLANERLFLKYFKLGILVCNVSTVIYYFGNPVFGISYTFGGLIFIAFGYYVYQWRERRIQQNPNGLPLDSMPSLYVIVSVLVILFIFNLINIYTGRYSTSNPARLHHLQNNNVITHRN